MDIMRPGDASFNLAWKRILCADTRHLGALYGEANLAFYREYFSIDEFVEHSFLLLDGGEPISGMRILKRQHPCGSIELSCCGLPLLYLENPMAPPGIQARAHKLAKTELVHLFNSTDCPVELLFREQLHEGYISRIGRNLLDLGAKATIGFTQIIDLAIPADELHRAMTKSFKWGVNWGEKNLELSIIDSDTVSSGSLEAFRLLHADSAGRETRSQRSWELQHEMIQANVAFCVFGSVEDRLVTAALFPHSASHCYYGVSASRRELFEKPLSHAIVWTALRHAKAMGLKYFELGQQFFPAVGERQPTKKELGISYFKRAFGGQTRAYLDIRLSRNEPGAGGT